MNSYNFMCRDGRLTAAHPEAQPGPGDGRSASGPSCYRVVDVPDNVGMSQAMALFNKAIIWIGGERFDDPDAWTFAWPELAAAVPAGRPIVR